MPTSPRARFRPASPYPTTSRMRGNDVARFVFPPVDDRRPDRC